MNAKTRRKAILLHGGDGVGGDMTQRSAKVRVHYEREGYFISDPTMR